MVTVATASAARVAGTGVPVRAEIRPRAAGPAPSRLAAAWVREDAITQVSPLATRIQRKASPARPPTSSCQGP